MRRRVSRPLSRRVEVLEERTTPATMFAVTSTNTLLTFDSATPGTIDATNAITGLQAGELVAGIDVRPATGQLYGLGLVDDGVTRTARIYTIDPATGAATQVGGAPWTAAYPDTEFGGFNFNPNVDLIRVISRNGPNFRVSPVTGALVGTDTNTSANGLNGVSYTNNDGFSPTTTLFGLNFDTNELVTVGGLNGTPSPNGGVVNVVGPTGIAAGDAYGFEIVSSGGVATAFASTDGDLFTVNLGTGALTLVGAIGGAPVVRGLTAALPGTITVGGTAGNDTVVVTATGPDAGSYTLNGGTAVTFTGLQSFSFIGGGGDDTLTINNPAGDLLTPAGGIIFHGGAGTANALVLAGGQSPDGSFTPTTTTDGGINHGFQNTTFTNVASVTDTVPAATFSIFGPATADTINVVDGPAAGLLQVNSGGTPTFTTYNLGNKTDVTLDAGDGDNSVTLNFTETTAAASLLVRGGTTDDAFNVQATAVPTSIAAGGGSDRFVFSDGATLTGGTINGEAGNDFLDHSLSATPVAVNLGLGSAGLSSVLNGGQEVPSNGSAAAGTATLANYNAATKTFDLTLTVTDLDPATVTGLHIHRGGLGVNGPVIIDLLPLGPLVPAGTGFTLTLFGLDLSTSLLGGDANEASFLGGQTYLNVHTAAVPTGVIRGQIFTTANVALASGTATGTGGVSNVENAFGGAAADSLVGNNGANILFGEAGNDTIVGGPGADSMFGGSQDDTLIWSNGDGSDVMDGGADNDTVAVNGALAGGAVNDVFTVNPNGTRVDFDRTSTGPFSLDIGTTETLRVNGGAGGNESFTVGDLTGVADLTAVHLFGLAGDDTFAVTPSSVAISATGGAGTDALNVVVAGTTDPFVTTGLDVSGGVSGDFGFGNKAVVTFAQTENLQTPSNIITVTKTDGLTSAVPGTVVTYTITVTNNSDLGVNTVSVLDGFPAGLTGVTWTAVFTAGSTGTANGVGTINEFVDLAAGGSVTYTATGTIAATASGTITNTATATVPTGLTDDTAADNTATDTTGVDPLTPLVVSGLANGSAAVFAPAAGAFPTTPTATVAPFGAIGANVRTATGDVNGDGIDDVIAVTGPGVPIRVAVLSGADNTTLLVAPFAPFVGSEDFTGGGFVAAGDFDFDGRAEIVVTPDQGGGPRVTIFSLVGTTLTQRANFFGITGDPDFRGGARPAVGDVNGDGDPDVAVAAGFLGGPRVALFSGTTILTAPTKLVNDFFAFPGTDATSLRNGSFVAIGDLNGDGFGEMIFGGGPGGAPRVFALSGELISAGNIAGAYAAPVLNFFVNGNTQDRGGARLAVKDADGDLRADLVVGSGEGNPSRVRVYLGANITGAAEPTTFQDLDPFSATLAGGVFVG